MPNRLIGFHAIEELLKKEKVQGTLYITGNGPRYDALIRLAQKRNLPVRRISRAKLQALTGLQSATDCALQIFPETRSKSTEPEAKAAASLTDFLEQTANDETPSTLLVLDCITDPQNLGAILRSADQFKVDAVILPQRGSAKVSPTVVKTSAGAAHYVRVFTVANLRRSLELLKLYRYWVYGTDMGGTPLTEAAFPKRCALVMGNEGKGMRTLTAAECDSVLSIPMSGHIDSLNVSVACGIVLYALYTAKR